MREYVQPSRACGPTFRKKRIGVGPAARVRLRHVQRVRRQATLAVGESHAERRRSTGEDAIGHPALETHAAQRLLGQQAEMTVNESIMARIK